MTVIRSFPPIATTNSRVLILGSMPGALSLAHEQYYAHPRNAFWPIMGELFGAGPDIAYAKRLEILQQAGVAVWDSLAACIRPGSLDSAIRDEFANDFEEFFAQHPLVTHVYFNGAKAKEVYFRHVLPGLSLKKINYTTLPSTSPAHAGRSFKEKLEIWRCITQATSLKP